MRYLRNQRGVVGLVALGLIVLIVVGVVGYQVYRVRSGHAQPLLQRLESGLPNWLHSTQTN